MITAILNVFQQYKIFSVAVLIVATFAFRCKEEHSHHGHQALETSSASKGSVYDLDLGFTNQREEPVDLRKFSGAPAIVSMIYTRCDSVCPIQAGNMLRIQQSLAPADRNRVQFVLFSFDENDRPGDMARFAEKMRLTTNWTLLTGKPDSVRELAAAIGFQYRKNQQGVFSHSAVIYLLNEKGEVIYQKEGTAGTQNEFAEQISRL